MMLVTKIPVRAVYFFFPVAFSSRVPAQGRIGFSNGYGLLGKQKRGGDGANNYNDGPWNLS